MLIFLSSVSYKFLADNTVSISILNLSLLIPFSNNMETGLLKKELGSLEKRFIPGLKQGKKEISSTS